MRTKVIKHGFFFKNKKLRTTCICGCEYETPARKVEKVDVRPSYAHFPNDLRFDTICPECGEKNRQWRNEMLKKANQEGAHEEG